MVNEILTNSIVSNSLATAVASKPKLIDETEVQFWLEWAGQKLLAMKIPSPYPKIPTAAWPTFAQDFHAAYGYTEATLRAAIPHSKEIQLMDEILLLPSLVSDPNIRRLLHARALITPVAQRRLYSWTKLGKMLRTDRRAVARLHEKGLVEILDKLKNNKAYSIRHSLALYT